MPLLQIRSNLTRSSGLKIISRCCFVYSCSTTNQTYNQLCVLENLWLRAVNSSALGPVSETPDSAFPFIRIVGTNRSFLTGGKKSLPFVSFAVIVYFFRHWYMRPRGFRTQRSELRNLRYCGTVERGATQDTPGETAMTSVIFCFISLISWSCFRSLTAEEQAQWVAQIKER